MWELIWAGWLDGEGALNSQGSQAVALSMSKGNMLGFMQFQISRRSALDPLALATQDVGVMHGK